MRRRSRDGFADCSSLFLALGTVVTQVFASVSDMKISRWVERIYEENDVGRGIGTTVAGAAGLAAYLHWADWVVAAFVAIIVFPVSRILASAVESYWRHSRKRTYDKDRVKDLFDSLGSQEKAVVQAFVWHGGSVITWKECNESPHFSAAGIESLISRDMMHASMTADGMRETFVLDAQLFDYAQTVLPNEPF